jgi:hypothetical protein
MEFEKAEIKNITIDGETKYDLESAKCCSLYCYNIISWNIKHCPISSVMIDNISCFVMKKNISGVVSVFYNRKKEELIFRLSMMKNYDYQEIKNKKKYSFTVENFTEHFIEFYIIVSIFVDFKAIRYCNNCYKPTYLLTHKELCKECHVISITGVKKIDCIKCMHQKQSKLKLFINKFLGK